MVQETIPALSATMPEPRDLLGDVESARMVAGRLREASDSGDDDGIDQAAADFEAFFIYYMLKTMRETVQKTGLLDGGTQEELYTSLQDQEIAKEIAAHGGMGIAKLLRDDILREELVPNRPANSLRPVSLPAQPVKQGEAVGLSRFSMPVVGELSSRYGLRSDPMIGDIRFHSGIDIAAPAGTVVGASGDGRVAFSGWLPGYGNAVIVEHDEGFSTVYGHHRENLVERGEVVRRGQPLGKVGETGRATGAHLHFEVRKEGLPVDPYLVI